MNRSHRALTLLAASSVTLLAGVARAQTAEGFALERVNVSERGSDWFANDSIDLRGHVRPAVGIVADYAHRPLVLYNADGSTRAALVRDELVLHPGASLNLWSRVRVGFDLPVIAAQAGDAGTANGVTFAAGDKPGVGDLRLGADVRLVGIYGDAFTLAAGTQLFLPTGKASTYAGDGAVRLLPRVQAAGDVGAFAYAAGVGFLYRANDDSFGPYSRGSEVTFQAAAGVRLLHRRLLVGPEIFGSTVVTDSDAFFATRQTPVEALLDARYAVTRDWRVALGAGPGLTRGLGEPSFRALFSIEWAPAPAEPRPFVEAEPHATVRADRDGDGIADDADACPAQAGTASEEPKRNGCPAPIDSDHDGIADGEDACPNEAGPSSSDSAKNGCPLPPDRDADGIIDASDACPEVAGHASDDAAKNGCPEVVADRQIELTGRVEFATGSAAIDAGGETQNVLKEVARLLKSNPSIKKVRVEGHTDAKGNADTNKTLSANRAASVVAWLVRAGIEPGRLTSAGFGSERPLAENETAEGRRQNRRVEFHIEQQSGGQ